MAFPALGLAGLPDSGVSSCKDLRESYLAPPARL